MPSLCNAIFRSLSSVHPESFLQALILHFDVGRKPVLLEPVCSFLIYSKLSVTTRRILRRSKTTTDLRSSHSEEKTNGKTGAALHQTLPSSSRKSSSPFQTKARRYSNLTLDSEDISHLRFSPFKRSIWVKEESTTDH